MNELVKIKPVKEEWKKRKMKSTGDIFEAKKFGAAFYMIKDSISKLTYKHLAKVVEDLSEEVV